MLNTYEAIRGNGQTVGAQTITVAYYTMPDGTAGMFEASAIGKDTSGNGSIYARKVAGAASDSGIATIVGTIQSLMTPIISILLIGANVTIDTSGNDVRVRATGVLGRTIDWQAVLYVGINLLIIGLIFLLTHKDTASLMAIKLP